MSAIEQSGSNPPFIRVHLERTRQDYVCGGCGRTVPQAYDHSWQELRHLPLWGHQTALYFQRYRVACPACGVRTEALEFADIRGPRVPSALAALAYELCKVTTVKAAALLSDLHRHTVKDIDKAGLEKVQAARSLDGITVLGVDEIGVGKEHKYWTLLSALGRLKKTLSGKKFILMARRARVRGKARAALDVVLAATPKLFKAQLLKESFGHLWDYRYKGSALRFWADWKAQLKWTRLDSYRNFVKMLERHWDGIVAFCDKKV